VSALGSDGRDGACLRQEALGHAVQRRSAEITAAVVADWSGNVPPDVAYADVLEVITRTSALGTELVGRYLVNGGAATPQEAEQLGESGTLTVMHDYAVTDLTKHILTWRDAILRVILEEGRRLEVDARVLEQAAAVVRAGADASLVRMVKEVDVERRELRQRLSAEHAKLTHLALHDPLTGLPNRTLLLDRLSHAVARRVPEHCQVAVLFLDLDGFKAVNDSFGHKAGDRVLVVVADCLTVMVRPADTVARFGGDEFVILCEDLRGGRQELDALASRIQTGVTERCAAIHGLAVTVSVGVAFADAASDPRHTLDRADAAMYAAKHFGPVRRPPPSR